MASTHMHSGEAFGAAPRGGHAPSPGPQSTHSHTPTFAHNQAASQSAFQRLQSLIDVPAIVESVERQVESYPWIQSLSNMCGVRPALVVGALVAFLLLSLGLGWGGGLVCDVAGFIYPAWMSFKAIESPGKDDDRQWLTYWVVYGAFSIVEYFVDIILFWLPFYYLAKFLFLVYLYLPCFKGAEVLYVRLVRPFLLDHESVVDAHLAALDHTAEAASSLVQQAVGMSRQRRHAE